MLCPLNVITPEDALPPAAILNVNLGEFWSICGTSKRPKAVPTDICTSVKAFPLAPNVSEVFVSVRLVVSAEVRSSSTLVNVPNEGLNCAKLRLFDQSVRVDEMGVVVVMGPDSSSMRGGEGHQYEDRKAKK